MWKDERMYVSKDGHLLAEGGNVFIPALWKGNNAIIAFSEEGYANKTWTLPNGISLSRKAKAWTISVDGQVEFKKYRIHNHQITLSLAPYEMILIEE